MSFVKTEKQIQAIDILGSPAMYILLDGGSRSGKTLTFIRALILRALKVAKTRHLILRYRFNHVKSSIWYDTFPKTMELCFPGLKLYENKSDWFWRFPNKSEIWIGGLDEKERTEKILGNEYSTIYFNESSQMQYASVTTALSRLAQKTELVNKAYFDCNPPKKKHWSYKLFFEHLDPVTNEPKNKDLYARLQMNPVDNEENLADGYIENVLGQMSERQRKRFRDGIWLDDNEKALWRQAWIDKNRLTEIPNCYKMVVAVDPAASADENSAENGIIIVGEGKWLNDPEPHYFVIDDLSLIGTPNEWAIACIKGYRDNMCDRIIAEKNNGGLMVQSTIKNVDPSAPVSLVWASRGKEVRAEPVSALYEQGKVHHIGAFPELEDQLTEWIPGEKSPDRLDALVWGISWLAGFNNTPPTIRTNQLTSRTKSKVR